jgi:hypothetical protein
MRCCGSECEVTSQMGKRVEKKQSVRKRKRRATKSKSKRIKNQEKPSPKTFKH